MICENCGTVGPIEDQGIIYIRPAFAKLTLMLQNSGCPVTRTTDGYSVSYSNRDELLSLLQLLQALSPEERQQLFFSVSQPGRERSVLRWIPLHLLEERLQHGDVVNLILSRQFTSYLQPIVNREEEIVAYEFLLRPLPKGPSFQPMSLFEVARKTGLHSFLDRSARISAIEMSARRLPNGIKRFVNFLPSSIYNPEFCLTHTLNAIHQLQLDPADFVFEVVETEKIEDVSHLQSIFEVYRKNGISVAMDDVGSGYATVEQVIRLKPDYVKIDRALVQGCDENHHLQKRLERITDIARDVGAVVLAEGIERRQEYEICREIGIELAQGYLFGKPAAEPVLSH